MTESLPAETLLLEGADAAAFAHAQFSSAVTALPLERWQFSAWLDPKGRVLALFHLARLAEDKYLLLLRGGTAAAMAGALQRFVFRSKVRITALPPRQLAAGPALAEGSLLIRSFSAAAATEGESAISFGCGSHSLVVDHAANNAWRLPQLRSGWPWLSATILGELLPPALSLQRLHAVVVDKGCYPGQEIVARMHFRGGHKRHLHLVSMSQPQNPGDSLQQNGREVGRVLDVVAIDSGCEALVVLHDDVAAQANDGATLSLGDGIAISLLSSWPA